MRQLALLHFRNIITLNMKLEEALSRPRARIPPSIIQMLLVLQVHTGWEWVWTLRIEEFMESYKVNKMVSVLFFMSTISI